MKISQSTIDRVIQDVRIEEIISDFMELKKEGANYKGLSPFTQEKTASFVVSPSKNIFKCFSSGTGGGAVKFLMEVQHMTFPDAIKYIADKLNIEMEYDQQANPEAYQKKVNEKQEYFSILKSTANQYAKQLKALDKDHPALEEIAKREITEDDLIQWQIGYAPKGSFINNLCKDNGVLKPALELKIIKEKWDVFQHRLMYPIQDEKGNVVGFGGRALEDPEQIKKYKWINSSDSKIYDKSKVLFGLNFAIQSINKKKFAILAEGFNDVISLHKHGCDNAVGSCGTNFTDDQIKLLKRYTNNVCLMYDGDQAGVNAALKIVPVLLAENIRIDLFPLPNDQDPDDFLRGFAKGELFTEHLEDNKQDAMMYLAGKMFDLAGSNIHKQKDATDVLISWLAAIKNPLLRIGYSKSFSTTYKIPKKVFDQAIDNEVKAIKEVEAKKERTEEPEDTFGIPDGIDKEEALRNGFYGNIKGKHTGYFFQKSKNSWEQISNFVITPLFHKYDIDDNTRIIKIDNGISASEIVEMPSKALISADQFKAFLFDKGAFLFYGSKIHLDKLNNKFLHEFPKAFELKTLGWQNEGFFAFFNASFNGKLEQYNNVGIVQHGDKNYFSPASSDIYKDFRKDDDMYENDRYLEYIESDITFGKWAKLMEDVYEDHAKVGVPFVLMSMFRDLVFKVDNNAPFLYAYGKSKSGKSKFAESISNVFFKEMSAFNLNSGTDFAFSKRLGRFKNCPVFFNEFDDNVVKDEWFQALKGAYDGEGRERGKGGSKNKTEILKVHCSLILVGQFLSTKDDNSVLSRSLLRTFKIKENRDEKQNEAYNLLKSLEKKGLSSMITELLLKRSVVEKEYYTLFNDNYKAFIVTIRANGQKFEERVVRNYCSLFTLYKMFHAWIDLPWEIESLYKFYVKEIVKLSNMIKGSDILVNFWTTIETMYSERIIAPGQHFKIETKLKVRLTKDGTDSERVFSQPKQLLYMRVRNVQMLYAKFKKTMGEHPMDITSLISYLHDKDYFIGYVNSERFSKVDGDSNSALTTSAYIFDYEALEIALGNSKDIADLPF